MNTKDQLIKWFCSGDSGVSSTAIAAQMTGNNTGRAFSDHPGDSGDFGRCYRLLMAVPEFRSRISEMAQRSPQWAALVDCWDELEALYETDGSACHKRMKEIQASVPDPRRTDVGNGASIYS